MRADEPTTGAAPRRRSRDRKQQILNAARDLFAQSGYPNVTMAQIAERVGITAGALYRHFSNKSVLLQEVIAQNFAWLDEPIAHTDYDEVVEAMIAIGIDRPYVSDLWTHEIRYLSEETVVDLRMRMRKWNRSLAPALLRRRPDLDPGQEELLAWALQSLLSCLGRQAIHSPMSVRLPAVRAAMAAIVTAGLEPTGRATVPQRPRLAPVSMRERLLLAAFDQFGERGFQDASMASIAALADVTGPNLYSYFESKAELLRAVLDRGTHALWLSVDQAFETSATHREVLEKLVRSYVSLSRSWATIEDPTGEYAVEEPATALQREYVAEWVALLQQVHPGLARRPARMRVQLGLFLISDLYRNPRVSRHESFVDNLCVLVMAVLFDGVAAEPTLDTK